MDGKWEPKENPIRTLIRGAVIVQDINPFNLSDGLQIVLQQGVVLSTLFK